MTTTATSASSSLPASPEPSSAARTSPHPQQEQQPKGKAKAATPDETDDADADDDADGDEDDDTHDNEDNGDDESTPAADAASSPTAPASSGAAATATASAGDWQAIFSPTHNAYYFYNTVTQETTWTNPLQSAEADVNAAATTSSPPPADAGTTASSTSAIHALQAAAAAQGIDPALAYLDPTLASTSTAPSAFTYTAKFNARTGAFARPDGRDPTHLSEYERAKRMSEAYFDVGQWEQDVEARDEQELNEGKKRKRPTKKDLERYKEQKKLKKIAKTAWLRT